MVIRAAYVPILVFAWLASACSTDRRPTSSATADADLQLLQAHVDLVIGRTAQPHAAFLDPVPLGSDAEGDIYIIDPRAREVGRFSPTGDFRDLVAKAGGGPGEIRIPPLTFGLISGVLWFTDYPTGRIYFINPAHPAEIELKDTGLSPSKSGAAIVKVSPLQDSSIWAETTTPQTPQPANVLRPNSIFEYSRYRGGELVDSLKVTAPGRGLLFDGGKTSVRYPGPPDQPVVLPVPFSGTLRLDRPVPRNAKTVEVRVSLTDRSGATIRERTLDIPVVPLAPPARDSIEQLIVRGASWGGSRSLDRATRKSISQYVASIPHLLPAFEDASVGDDGAVWLKTYASSRSGTRDWLVLDSIFTPVARVQVPASVTALYFREDHRWWCTMQDPVTDTKYVARLQIDPVTR